MASRGATASPSASFSSRIRESAAPTCSQGIRQTGARKVDPPGGCVAEPQRDDVSTKIERETMGIHSHLGIDVDRGSSSPPQERLAARAEHLPSLGIAEVREHVLQGEPGFLRHEAECRIRIRVDQGCVQARGMNRAFFYREANRG